MSYSSQLRNAALFFVFVFSASGAMAMLEGGLTLACVARVHLSGGSKLIAIGAGNIADSMSESNQASNEEGVMLKNTDWPVCLKGAAKCAAGIGVHLGTTYLVSRAFRSEEMPSRRTWWFGATCKTAAVGLHTLGGGLSAWSGLAKVLLHKGGNPVKKDSKRSVLTELAVYSGLFHLAGAGVDLVGSYLMG